MLELFNVKFFLEICIHSHFFFFFFLAGGRGKECEGVSVVQRDEAGGR